MLVIVSKLDMLVKRAYIVIEGIPELIGKHVYIVFRVLHIKHCLHIILILTLLYIVVGLVLACPLCPYDHESACGQM